MSINEKFLEALGASLKKETVSWNELSQEEWQQLFQFASKQQVLPLVYEAVYKCPAAKMQPELMEVCSKRVFAEVARQVMKTNGFLELYQKLRDAGAKPLVMKGLICRSLYLRPDHRSSTDEDILIPKEQFEIAHQVMMDAGMQLMEPEKDIYTAHEVPYVKKSRFLYIEMHKSPFPDEVEAYGDYNHFFEGVHERAIKETIQGEEVYTLAYTDHLLYLICHAFKHFLHSGVGVRQVCDIVLFANAHGSKIDWKWILECCRQMQAEKWTAAIFKLGEKYFKFDFEKTCYPLEWQKIEVDEDALLHDMLDGGVFGSAEKSRIHSSNITLNAVSAQKKGKKVKGTVLKTVFPPGKYMAGQYKYLDKHPYLLPVAWISRIVKYGKEIQNSKSNNPSKSIEIGNQRIALMKEYGVIKEDEN